MHTPETTDELSDDELCSLALAADPRAPLDPDAVPIDIFLGTTTTTPLPSWYMPMARSTTRSPIRTAVVMTVIFSFVLIDALGLCNTFGVLTWA